MSVIDSFDEEYSFLSNSYRVPILLDEHEYPSVVHAIEAAKTNDPIKRAQILKAHSPGVARSLGRHLVPRPGWHGDRIDVMRALIADKFSYEFLAERLLATGNAELVEGTGDEDDFWGVFVFEDGSRRGQNWIGKILVEIRSALRSPT